MPKIRQADGTLLDVDLSSIFNDDGATPFGVPASTEQTFSAEDIARARGEEKDKLYGRIESLNTELQGFKDQVGSLTAAEQRRQSQAEEERQRLESEARQTEEAELDAKSLLQRREQEWQQQLQSANQTWEQKFEQEREERLRNEAVLQREREFSSLKEYTQQKVAENEDKIAPQLLDWITGNTQDEIDAAITRAISTTDKIAADLQNSMQDPNAFANQQMQQQPQIPQPLPGTRVNAGPANSDPAGQYQTLTPEQIANMPMAQYAQLRGQLGIGGSGNNRGLYG